MSAAISRASAFLAACAFLAFPLPSLTRADTGKPWTLVLLPDTQNYSYGFPDVFMSQTEWIAGNKDKRNIKLVFHLGDITDRNTRPEWLNARKAMDVLVKAEIPFVLVPGNHDIGRWGSSRGRATFLNEYFGSFDYNKTSIKRAYYERGHLENTWQVFETPWGPFMVIALEYLPRNGAVAWADRSVGRYPQYHAILVTHSYLSDKSTRYDWEKNGPPKKYITIKENVIHDPDGYNDGERMWRKLVSKHKNFLFTFNGHVTGKGTGYLASKGGHGNEVHQMLANYQKGVKPDHGMGWLRILEFQPDRRTIKVSTYSPHLDRWLTSKDQQFTITLERPLPETADKK